ncbi:membrane hypothetical protein [Candidatus Magnetomoraceae bacterium gMMP-15]
MKPLKTCWKPFVGLAFSIIYPSTAIFKKVGYLPLVLYIFIVVSLLLSILWIVPRMKKILTPSISVAGLSLLFVSVLGAYVVIHPQIDTDGFRLAGISFGSSDSDDAINTAIEECIEGRSD